MNLYFRLLWVFIRIRFLKKCQPLSQVTLNLLTMPNDLDIFMHVNNGRYLTFMDLGRLQFMIQTGIWSHVAKNRWTPLVGAAKVQFVRPLGIFNKFRLTTQIIYWDDKWFYMEQKIFRKEQLITQALFKALITSKNGHIKPDKLFNLFENPPQRPEIPEHLNEWCDNNKNNNET